MFIKLLLALLVLVPSVASADVKRIIEVVASTDNLANINVPNTATVITKSISLQNQEIESVGYMYKATSSGVIGVSIQADRSYDRPATEAVASATYVPWNAAATTTDASWHMATLDTVVMPFLRFRITGTGSNDNTTTVQIKLQKH